MPNGSAEISMQLLPLVPNSHKNLSPMFQLLQQLQKISTARDDNACGLAEDINKLFAVHLHKKGPNLDGNRHKKRALIDFLLCVPEMLETVLKKKHIVNAFVEADMIDEFEQLMAKCKRWGLASKDVGVQKSKKDHCRQQFQSLMKLQLKNGQISYPDMKEVGIPLGAYCSCCCYYHILSVTMSSQVCFFN